MEIETKTSAPNVKLKNSIKGLGWEINDSQRDGEKDLKETIGRIEEVNKTLIEKFGEPGEREKPKKARGGK